MKCPMTFFRVVLVTLVTTTLAATKEEWITDQHDVVADGVVNRSHKFVYGVERGIQPQ